MARKSANFRLDSLKVKIRLAACALAFFICTFGLVSYLTVSFLTTDVFFAVFIPFLILAGATIFFGCWLSNEVAAPIEKVSLLAKSLERGALTSLPKTSGSIETDELLQTLHRNNQQMQALVGLMDKVAAGDLDAALSPLQNSDRLTVSFQKLLAKVSESIQAKKDLEKLRGAIGRITEEISPVRNGNFDVEIKSDSIHAGEIAETFRFLIDNFNELVARIKTDSLEARGAAIEIKRSVGTIIEQDENKIRRLNQAALTLGQIPKSIEKVARELSDSSISATQSIEKARLGTQASQKNLDAVGALRKQIQESAKRVGRLGEHSQEIANAAKAVADLARRTKMIALNASIQAGETNGQNRGISILAEEIERLAARAENADKQISALGKSISADIGEVENSLQATVGEAANLSKFAIEAGNSLNELEKYVGQFLNLQTKLGSQASEQSFEADAAFQVFISSISETEGALKNLKESEANAERISNSADNLQFAVADYKVSENSGEKSGNENEYGGAPKIIEPNVSV